MKKWPCKGIIFALLTIIFGSWAADGLKGEALFSSLFSYIKDYQYAQIVIAIMVFVLFVCFFLLLYKHRNEFFAVRVLLQQPCLSRSCLILFLSTPNIPLPVKDFPWELTDRDKKTAKLEGKSLEDDNKVLCSIDYWNWQQILRGLIPHKNKLGVLFIIGSKDGKRLKGSFLSLSGAEKLIKQYLPDLRIEKYNKAIDFENFEELIKCLNETISTIKQSGFSERDIIIDVTGGQKTTSIAGAAITFNNEDIVFQYVETNEPYEVLSYNVVIQSPVTP